VAQTRPIENFNGVNLCAWGSEYPAWPRSSWPVPLMRELVSRYGSHPLVNEYRLSISPVTEAEYRTFYTKLTNGLERKARICIDILRREPWNLSLIVFPEVHWAMHLLWQTYDATHPGHDPDIELPFDNIFLDLYRRLDAWIDRFTQEVPQASVIVFSGSGLGPNYSGWHLLPEILERIGMGPDASDRRAGRLSSLLPMRKWGASKIRKLEDTLSVQLIERLKKTIPAPIWDRATRRLLFAGNQWADSRAFCLPNDYSGAIRINLQGREPAGKVSPGAEYDRVCEEISAELKALVNTDTGKPAVAKVIRPADLYPADALGDFPDLIAIWSNDAAITSLRSDRIGIVSRDFPERRSGAHRDDCFMLSNVLLNTKRNPASTPSILDIAPTIYDLLSAEPPSFFDGESLVG
jgi:predicted AlkP superfamily phosphohydrolase/phosphomutase